MDFWTFVCIAMCVSAGVSLLTKIIENDKEARVAKIEANLKRDLVERLGDANLVAQVVQAKLSSAETAVPRPGEAPGGAAPQAFAAQHANAATDARQAPEERKEFQGLLLGGLITTLVGVAFFCLCGF